MPTPNLNPTVTAAPTPPPPRRAAFLPTLNPIGPFPQPFGRYEVRQLLGRGGMGSVYLAHDSVLQVEVALKVPHPDLLADPYIREQVLHEARAGVRLVHPNICRVLDFGIFENTPYLSLQYIAGEPLSRCRPAGQSWWEPGEATNLVHTLATALSVAHAQGIIHRDLKPGNVLLTPPPERKPFLTDFGLALRLNTAEAHVPMEGEITGTLPYMPPEQVRVGLVPLGPGADIYSLGVILYELLTGRLPFNGPNYAEVIPQILQDEPLPPSKLRAGLDPALDAICLKALAKRVHDRFLSMDEFGDSLARASIASYLNAADAKQAPAPPRPVIGRDRIRFAFAGYGTTAPPAAVLRDRLFLDVGNDLRAGVLDHHHLVAFSGSTTSLLLNRPDLVEAAIAPDHRADEPFTIVLHEFPDLDCAASAFLATAYLTEQSFPAGADFLARYVDRVDEGSLGMSTVNPFSLYAAYHRLANRPLRPGASNAEYWQECVRGGMELIGYVLAQVASQGTALPDVDAFACPGLFTAEDRQFILADLQRYERKLLEARAHAQPIRLRLPGQYGGMLPVEALLVRDVQNEDDPERCLFFKDWARSDRQRCGNGQGFVALSVFSSEGIRQRRQCILSVTPDSRASLRGLGALLDEAEASRRRQANNGVDDRVTNPTTGEAKAPRPGYTNSDPWYDGRAHGFTIVDAPRSGTMLTADEIEAIFLQFGGESVK
jgi:serine/threonine protein kinase